MDKHADKTISYEPRHLLEFTGNAELQLHYRSLIYNLHRKKGPKDEDHCRACNAELSTQHEGARLKPAQKMTKAIQKLVSKKSRKIPLSRVERYKLNKFMNSSQQMVIKCPVCTFINKKSTIGRRDLIKLKSKLMSEVEEAVKQEMEESREEEKMDISQRETESGDQELGEKDRVQETEGNGVDNERKKKKKKKKNKKTKDVIATLIHQKASERKQAKILKKVKSAPVSLRDFVKSETSEILSSATPVDVIRNVFHSSDSSFQQTPVSTAVNKVNSQSQYISTATPSSKKSRKKSKKDKDLIKSLFFETPATSSNVRSKSTPNNQTPTSVTPQLLSLSSASSKKSKKKIVQKELRKYLTEVPQVQQKTSSNLNDFLFSL